MKFALATRRKIIGTLRALPSATCTKPKFSHSWQTPRKSSALLTFGGRLPGQELSALPGLTPKIFLAIFWFPYDERHEIPLPSLPNGKARLPAEVIMATKVSFCGVFFTFYGPVSVADGRKRVSGLKHDSRRRVLVVWWRTKLTTAMAPSYDMMNAPCLGPIDSFLCLSA
jgi:hypothetical protein